MFGLLINYWNLTGDTSYNDIVYDAMQFQVGGDANYMPQNQTKDLGNDDQVFWAFSAMDAAESNFRNPPSDKPQWLALAQAVFNSQAPQRWDTAHCNGGLRWQIYQFNAGYDYKNTISTGGLFQLAARLARFTGNSTYADWAEKTWDWMEGVPIMGRDQNGTLSGDIWDGVYIVNNCSSATQTYWTYNVGTVLMGASYMYNYTNGSQIWADRVATLMKGTDVFFVQSAGTNPNAGQPPAGGEIAAEVACEPPVTQTCNNDEPSFKAYMIRWLAVTAQLVPWTHDTIMPRIQASAQGAAGQCSGTANGLTNACGRRWYQTTWDGFNGVGEEMSALSVVQNLLIDTVAPPVTGLPHGGGTSVGNPSAGTGESDADELGNSEYTSPITTGDRAGAGILTALALILVIGGTWWMII